MPTEFNPNRFISLDLHGKHQHLNATKKQPLNEALKMQHIQPNTPVLYTNHNDTVLVFQTRHFALYNVLQSPDGESPWMATFCSVCNAGTSFSPVVDNIRYDFYGAGFYDAMTLIADTQTGSYWNHITGECIAGKMRGILLQQLANLTHSTAEAVAKIHPDAQLIISSLDAGRASMDDFAEGLRTSSSPDWLPALHDTLDTQSEDTRLPRLEMGLGVWTPTAAHFYPFKTINMFDNILFDQVDDQRLLVYVDPETFTPSALYTDATAATWRGETLMLNNGQMIKESSLVASGDILPMKRPLQLFQRWYGFSITFPGCNIYTAEKIPNIATF
ncbi:MAG: DUF3179 domain-containing protein [Anaerolineae bacterium]|nr:DUF3179 domain-containing protein [Anaerolineae bacterium]